MSLAHAEHRSVEERLAAIMDCIATIESNQLPPENAMRYLRANGISAEDMVSAEGESAGVQSTKLNIRQRLKERLGSAYVDFVQSLYAAESGARTEKSKAELRSVPVQTELPQRPKADIKVPGLDQVQLKQDAEAVVGAYRAARATKDVGPALRALAREQGVNVNGALAALAEPRLREQLGITLPPGFENPKEYIG